MIGTGSITVKERSSCILIDDKILIDCGNGTIKTLLEQNVDINKIDTLLITHLHGDHFLDIPFLIIQRKHSFPDNELAIYCPKGTEEAVGKIIDIAYPSPTDWKILRDKTKVKFIEFETLNNTEITKDYFVDSYNVVHGNSGPSYGYIIKNNDKSVGISGDSTYCENIDKIVKESDLSILDMSFEKSNEKHMGVDDIKMLFKKYNKRIISTHMSEEARQCALKLNIKSLIVPNDGDEIVI